MQMIAATDGPSHTSLTLRLSGVRRQRDISHCLVHFQKRMITAAFRTACLGLPGLLKRPNPAAVTPPL